MELFLVLNCLPSIGLPCLLDLPLPGRSPQSRSLAAFFFFFLAFASPAVSFFIFRKWMIDRRTASLLLLPVFVCREQSGLQV